MQKNIRKLVFYVLGLSVLACATLTSAPPTSTMTRVPTEVLLPAASPTPVFTPTPEALLLGQAVILSSDVLSETNQTPLYTLNVQTPVLQGRDDPRVTQFNQAVAALVQDAAAAFKEEVKTALDTPEGSSFVVTFTLVSPPGDLVSLKFNVTGYLAGAAHPYHVTRTFTYQLSTGKELTLDQLFLPGADYLQALADYCQPELQQHLGDAFFAGGADPQPENYVNWNLAPDGLLITFDEYQVAPYAAGPQTVTILYTALTDIVDPQGPLAALK